MSDAPPPPAEQPPPNGDAPADGSPPAGRPSPPRRTGPRPWQGGRYHSTARRGPGGRLRAILILLAVMLALAGAVVAWVLYPGSVPRPYFTALAIDQYTDPRIPPNQWTAQDREALRGRGWPESNAFTSQQKDRLVAELRNLGRNQPADQPLVIYLRAYALPTDKGELAVLPGDANLDDETSWLPLRDVLGFVRDCPVRRKLLLLDVAQPFADARAGAVANDAAGRAEPIVQKTLAEDPNLLVLCACSPGQTSLASEEMGHTVFVHYLLEGLEGAADGWGGGAQDNRVSARELAAYTTAQVDRWAMHDRGARQTPVLLGPEGMDFGLTVDQSAAPAVDAPLDKTYPQWLKDAWQLRDRWQADLRIPTPAPLYRDLERDALDAEARWRGGAKPEEVQAILKGRMDSLEADPRRRHPVGAAVRESLALAEDEGRKPPARDKVEDAVFQLGKLAELLPPGPPATGPAPPPDPAAAAQLEARKKAFLKDYEDKPFELAFMVVQAAQDPRRPDPRPDVLRLWLSLLRPEKGKPPDYEELHILELLSNLEVKEPAKEWRDVVGPAVELAEETAQAHAELDLCPPGPLTDRLRQAAQKSDELRQAAEDALLNASPADRAKAVKMLDPTQSGGRSYESLRKDAASLRAALRCRDDALTLLPGYAVYLEHEPGRETDWKQAVEQTRLLRDVLAKPPGGGEGPPSEWFRETDAQTRSLRDGLNNLLRPVNSRLPTLIPPSPKAGAADAEDMRAMLRLPALSAPDRVALWEAWRGLADRLNQDDAGPSGPAAEPLPPPDAEKAKKDEDEKALLRARVSLLLLKLDGGDGSKAQAALDRAVQKPSDETALPELGRELRAAWKRLDETHKH